MLRATARLHLNEMPYPPPADVLAAARRCLSDLHRYTDAEELDRLREQLAEYSEVPKRRVVLSPGSDLLLREIIHIIEERERLRETLDELGARVFPAAPISCL
jgi:histidinol-phosphate/aromatic aminotransferase/cobyric acid decarboxylase-like protein